MIKADDDDEILKVMMIMTTVIIEHTFTRAIASPSKCAPASERNAVHLRGCLRWWFCLFCRYFKGSQEVGHSWSLAGEFRESVGIGWVVRFIYPIPFNRSSVLSSILRLSLSLFPSRFPCFVYLYDSIRLLPSSVVSLTCGQMTANQFIASIYLLLCVWNHSCRSWFFVVM